MQHYILRNERQYTVT